jgi:broad specificity phosphatase PhoE
MRRPLQRDALWQSCGVGELLSGRRRPCEPAAPSSPTTTLVLIRHGHTADNTAGAGARLLGWSDVPLSSAGREQVRLLCARMVAEPPDVLYTSPLRRALETATALGAALDLRPRVRAGLREINCGDVDGLPITAVRRDYPLLWTQNQAQVDDTFRWPGGESYSVFRARCERAVQRIVAAHRGQRIAVVTHTGVITQVLGALRGTPSARWGTLRAGNASLTVVRWGARNGVVAVFNDRAHLLGGADAIAGASPTSPASPASPAGRQRRQTMSARRRTRR